jgi:hypothetical protein
VRQLVAVADGAGAASDRGAAEVRAALRERDEARAALRRTDAIASKAVLSEKVCGRVVRCEHARRAVPDLLICTAPSVYLCTWSTHARMHVFTR